jgi:hypothetical protein
MPIGHRHRLGSTGQGFVSTGDSMLSANIKKPHDPFLSVRLNKYSTQKSSLAAKK